MPSRPVARDARGETFRRRGDVLRLVALVGIPFVALAFGLLWRVQTDGEQNIASDRQELALSLASTTDAFVVGNLDVLRAAATHPEILAPADPSVLQPVLQQYVLPEQPFNSVSVSGPDGWNIASSATPPRTATIADRPYFQQMLATGQPVVSPAVYSRFTGLASIILATPVAFNSGGEGGLVGGLSLQQLQSVLHGLVSDNSIQLIIVDSQGQIFVHPDSAVVQELRSAAGQPDVDAALRGESGTVQREQDGQRVLSAYAPVPSAHWAVLLVQPADIAFAPVRQTLLQTVAVLALGAVITAGIAWWLSGRLAGSYARLDQAHTDAAWVAGENEQRRLFLERLIATAPLGIAVTRGPEHIFELANPLYRAMLPGRDLIGRPLAEVMPELARIGTLTQLDDVFRTGQGFSAVDGVWPVRLPEAPRRPHYVTVAVNRLLDGSGQPSGLLHAVLDTTPNVEARARAERQRDELLASVSHDLRNPLTIISGQADLLGMRARRSGSVSLEQLEPSLRAIKLTVTRTTALVNELIDASHLHAGRSLDLVREPTDLVALAREAVALHASAASGSRIVLESDIPSVYGRWDPRRIERVLANLLSNALKYSPADSTVLVRVWREDGDAPQAVLAVQDHGVGIPAADQPHVFDGFHRGRNVAGAIAGTGLGLAGARSIVEAHGGTLDVESREGQGSTFTLTLPLELAPPGS